MVMEYQDEGVISVGWITGEFNLGDLIKKTTMTGNKSHNLVDSIFLNTASPIGCIGKAYARLYMGAFKCIPHCKSSHRKWVLGLYLSVQINHQWLSIFRNEINMRVNIQAVGQTYQHKSDKHMIYQ